MTKNSDRLYSKYTVVRNDGKELTPCIVLEVKDEKSRKAILHYARLLMDENPDSNFAKDLWDMVTEWKFGEGK